MNEGNILYTPLIISTENGEYDIGNNKIQVIVAIPTVEVYMKMDETLIVGKYFEYSSNQLEAIL